ncbi:hypothetical protein A3746_18440 [Oleibacter sp. HI0075]|nr:hypothetical protein A3746_18440 [Oleibacter sp. HI0075]
MIGLLQAMSVAFLFFAGQQFGFGWVYYLSLVIGATFLGWQIWNARSRNREDCFRVFRQSHWFGAIVWLGIVGHYLLSAS